MRPTKREGVAHPHDTQHLCPYDPCASSCCSSLRLLVDRGAVPRRPSTLVVIIKAQKQHPVNPILSEKLPVDNFTGVIPEDVVEAFDSWREDIWRLFK